MKRLLLVDDEQNVLNALRRELQSEYEIESYTSPVDALHRCRDRPFDLAIADYQMPGMNGIEFLTQLHRYQPDAAHLLLSGQADIHALLGAINKTHVYRFITKPWEEADLKACISQALGYRDILLENRRLAAAHRQNRPGAEIPEEGDRIYRVMLVDGDQDSLKLMRHGLTLHPGQDNLYETIHRDVADDRPAPARRSKLLIDSFSTPGEALEHARHHAHDLVIATQNLRNMDGIRFLREYRKIQPDAERILVSDHADKKLLAQAINEAQVYCFLNICWNSYELKADVRRQAWNIHLLKSAVMEALSAHDLMLENRRLAGEMLKSSGHPGDLP